MLILSLWQSSLLLVPTHTRILMLFWRKKRERNCVNPQCLIFLFNRKSSMKILIRFLMCWYNRLILQWDCTRATFVILTIWNRNATYVMTLILFCFFSSQWFHSYLIVIFLVSWNSKYLGRNNDFYIKNLLSICRFIMY